MKNYICINGNKTELTEEQLKQLGIELPKVNPFSRVRYLKEYYHIGIDGNVYSEFDQHCAFNEDCFNVANYCTDSAILEQRALHETLNRLLWRYSMEHDGDKIDWAVASKNKYYIYYSYQDKMFIINYANTYRDVHTVYFYKYETAENAIEEIIKPFMKAHPEFKF